MICIRRQRRAASVALFVAVSSGCAAVPRASHDSADRWIAQTITVRGLPPHATGVPVSCDIDLTETLTALGIDGAVDERTLRLARPGRGDADVPLQFTPTPQPRANPSRLLPATPSSVSFLGEHAAGLTPRGPRVAGRLTWLAEAGPDGTARYRLRFAVRGTGHLTQVPYAPRNLRGFDAEGRATPVHGFPRMQIRPLWPLNGVVHLLEDSKLVTTYHVGPTADPRIPTVEVTRRPFLYPVIGPDGVPLTEFGKPHDPTGSHAHHYSLWVAHFKVNDHDFWSDRDGSGRILHDRFDEMEDGPVFCRLVQRTHWQLGDQRLLNERRSLTVYRSSGHDRLIDIDMEFTPAGAAPVTFGQTTFGFLAVRVAQSINVFDGGGEILTAAGQRNESGAHRTRAPWLDQSGPIGQGKWNGIAVFDHPGNPHHPSGWHCRNDGWAGAAFNMTAPYTLDPGQTLRLRYRIHLHRNDAARGHVAERYAQYAADPTVQLETESVSPAVSVVSQK